MDRPARWSVTTLMALIVAAAAGCPDGSSPSGLPTATGVAPDLSAAPDGKAVQGDSESDEVKSSPSADKASSPVTRVLSDQDDSPTRAYVITDNENPGKTLQAPSDPVESDPRETDKPNGNHEAQKEEAREPLFEGWPKPRLALFVTGQQHGYIEPCGCTGLANQKGGLARRHTFLEQLRAAGWPVVPLDVGDQVRRLGPQAETKYYHAVDALGQMGYQGVTYGPHDLRLSSGNLAAAALNAPNELDQAFVACNVSVLSLTPTHRIIQAGGLKVGVTGVLGAKELETLKGEDDLTLSSPDEGLKAIWKELEAANCQLYVLLAHTSVEEARELAKRHPHFHLIVTTGLGEPTLHPERIDGTSNKTMMIQTGNKGMYVGVLALFADEPRIRYQRVPLDDRFADSPQMRQAMKKYQEVLKGTGLRGLGALPLKHPSGQKFAGTEACKDCHEKAYSKWKTTPHSHATDSLVNPQERSDIPRHYDPECLSCHVTGWAPQDYTPFVTGYSGLESTPQMLHNGCENCHGPAQQHVDIENGDKEVGEQTQNKVRQSLQLPIEAAKEQCISCHDIDNSPDFFKPGAFERYWEAIEHYGKD